MAASRGKEATVKLLLENGADIEAKDSFDQTPLIAAASRGDEATVELLLEKGANAKAKVDTTSISVAKVSFPASGYL